MSVQQILGHVKDVFQNDSSLTDTDLINVANDYLMQLTGSSPSTDEAERLRTEIHKLIVNLR